MNIIFTILLVLFTSTVIQPAPVEAEQPAAEEVLAVGEVTSEPEAELEPETPTEASQSSSQGTSSQKPASVPSTPLQPAQKAKNDAWKRGVPDELLENPNADHISNIFDLETIYMGWCPKDVPADAWADALSPSVAIGLRSTTNKQEMYSIDGRAKMVLNTYRRKGYSGTTQWVAWIEDMGIHLPYNAGDKYTDGIYYSDFTWYDFVLDIPTLTVYVDSSQAIVKATDAEMAQMQAVANQLTAKIRQLDAEYTAKCGK